MNFTHLSQILSFCWKKKKVFSLIYKYASYREIYYRQSMALQGFGFVFGFVFK